MNTMRCAAFALALAVAAPGWAATAAPGWKSCWGNFDILTPGASRDTNKGALFIGFTGGTKPGGKVWRRFGQTAFDAPRQDHKGYDLLGTIASVTSHGGGRYSMTWGNGRTLATVELTEGAAGVLEFVAKVPNLRDAVGTMTCR